MPASRAFEGPARVRVPPLAERFKGGLAAPICLTWEWTYACNLSCVHCLSSPGWRDPLELSTAEIMAVIGELAAMQVFYVNVGGGGPTVHPDFWDLLDYAAANRVGVKLSTNGVRGHGLASRSPAGQRKPPCPGKDHSRHGRAVALGMPSRRAPARGATGT